MPYTLRPAIYPDDYPPIVALINAVSMKPTTVADLADGDQEFPEGSVLHRTVAVDERGQVVGLAEAYRFPNTKSGKFYVAAIVEEGHRRRGLGSTLLAHLERFVAGHGATQLTGYVRDDDSASLAYVNGRGYQTERHGFVSALDLGTWNPDPFVNVLPAVKASGIRLFPMADEPGEGTAQKLYELMSRTMVDIPGYEASQFMSFQTWSGWVLKHSGVENVLIAADGDRFVGVSIMNSEGDELYTSHTSVEGAYRGRRIALALKLAAIDVARQRQVTRMTTGNDSLNQPILAVNRKLGYQPLVGEYEVVKRHN